MGRLRRKDATAVESVRAELRRIDLGAPMGLPRLLAMLRETIGAERALGYRVSVVGEQYSVEDVCSDGFDRPEAFGVAVTRLLEQDGHRGLCDLISPERNQPH